MLTKADKKYINDTLDQKLDEKLDQKLDEKLDKKLTEFRSDILNHVDAVMGEVKAMREDFAILNNRQSKHDEQLENYEGRLTTLEQDFSVAT